MNLIEMTAASNAFTDENIGTNLSIHFVNDIIGKINTELKSDLPFITSPNDNYIALSEKWQRTLFIPYISWATKMNDGSLNEASIYEQSYLDSFRRLIELKYDAISEEYRTEDFEDFFEMNKTNGINLGWFK